MPTKTVTKNFWIGLFSLILCNFVGYTNAASVEREAGADKVPDFRLIDSVGESHSLYYLKDKAAIVFWSLSQSCLPSVDEQVRLAQAQQEFAQRGVQFFFLKAANQTLSGELLTDVRSPDVPILNDDRLLVAKSLGFESANEILIINPRLWQKTSIAPDGSAVPYPDQREILAQLVDWKRSIDGGEFRTNCPLDFSLQETEIADDHYSRVVAPILQSRCLACHQEGGIAPWAMSSHNMIRGFAPMIKEVLATRRMPPWQADPAIGHWSNDQSLSVEERINIVNWIDAGAPRGRGSDPLVNESKISSAWPLGEPDLVIELPSYEIPVSGVVEYRYPVIENPLEETVWVRAATVRTNVPSVLHHVLVGAGQEQGSGGGNVDEILFNSFIQAYAPGTDTYEVPSGTGIEVKPEDVFLFQNHYTTDGLPHSEKTQLGLYFHKSRPEQPLRHSTIINKDLKIPSFAQKHEENAYFIFPLDATLYGLMPHAHYRGKSGRFELLRVDGQRETLLSVPNYDFNWQRVYLFEESVQVRAGDRLSYVAEYDNSLLNTANPDAEKEVLWGEQSYEEMLYGGFLFTWSGETFDDIKHDKQLMLVSHIIGYKDTNRDGIVQRKELPLGLRLASFGRFGKFDTNDDGGWSAAETSAFITWIQSVKWLRPFLNNI